MVKVTSETLPHILSFSPKILDDCLDETIYLIKSDTMFSLDNDYVEEL